MFGGFLVIHTQRIKAKRNAFIWCVKYESPTRLPYSNGDQNKPTVDQSNQSTSSIQADLTYSWKSKRIDHRNLKMVLTSSIRLMVAYLKNAYKYMITQKVGKALVVFTFVVYIALSSWQASKIREGIDLSDLVSTNSYYHSLIQDNLRNYDMKPFVMLVVHKPIDYTNKANVKKIKSLIQKCMNVQAINPDFVFNWMEYFDLQLKKMKNTNDSSILEEIKADRSPYANDVIVEFNQTSGQYAITASVFYVRYSHVHFSSLDAKPMNMLRELCNTSGLPVIPYAITFKYYEQFEHIWSNVIQAFVIAIEAMYLISLIFMPDLSITILVIFSMMSVMIGMIGFMHLWGLTLSSITMIELVMSVGFCIDFSAHLAHAFVASCGRGDRTKRAYSSCIKVGMPILNSALSSILGVFVLSLSHSYLFQSFFKTVFLVMVLGLLNSLLFLPVFLSIFGPHWKRHEETSI